MRSSVQSSMRKGRLKRKGRKSFVNANLNSGT